MPEVIHPVTGGVVSVPDEQLQQAVSEGYKLASPEAIAAERQKAEYSGLGHAAGALATGVASGATLGLSDAAISGLGGKDALQAYEQHHGGLRMAGEVGGTLLGMGKFAGPGMLAKGLRAGSMPARMAMQTGAVVERALGGKAMGLIARGATEGALFGVGQGVKEVALTDDPLTGEKVAAALASNMGTGALYGGAFTAGLYGIGKGASAIGRKITQVGDGGVPKLIHAWDRASSAIGASEPGAIKSMFATTRTGMKGHQVATMADDVVAKAADDVFTRADEVMRVRTKVGDNLTGALKEGQVTRIIKRGNEAEAYTASKAFIADMRGQFDDMIAREADFGRRGSVRDMRKKLNSLERKIDAANAAGDVDGNVRAFMKLDSFKRDLGKHTRKIKRVRGATSDIQATGYAFEGMYEKSRRFLEDVSTWGDAGALQKRMNLPWHHQIGAEKNFLSTITSPKDGMWGVKTWHVDREKIGKYVSELRDPNASQTHASLKQWLNTTQDFADAALESMHLPAGERKAIEQLATHTKALRGRLDDAAEAITLSNTLKDMGKQGDAGAVLGGIAGHSIIGGPVGGALGTAAAVISNPANVIHKVATIGRLVNKVDTKIAGGVRGFFRKAGGRSAVAIPRLTAPGARFIEKHNRYKKRDDEVRHVATNRQAVRDNIQAAVGNAAGAHPQAAEHATLKLEGINDFLMRKLPIGGLAGGFGGKPAASQAEIDKFLRFDEAATDPLKIPDLLEQGRLSPDHVEAVKTVWPQLFEQMQGAAMDELSAMEADGKTLPYRKRLQLGLLLDIPADRSMRPSMINMLQQGYQQPPGGPQGEAPPVAGNSPGRPGGKPPMLAAGLKTKTQLLEEQDE